MRFWTYWSNLLKGFFNIFKKMAFLIFLKSLWVHLHDVHAPGYTQANPPVLLGVRSYGSPHTKRKSWIERLLPDWQRSLKKYVHLKYQNDLHCGAKRNRTTSYRLLYVPLLDERSVLPNTVVYLRYSVHGSGSVIAVNR